MITIHFFFPQYSPIFFNSDSQLINAPRSRPLSNPGSFSSHISCTLITDTQSQSRNNSPTVQHRKLRPSPETDPLSAAKHLRRLFENKDDKYTNKQQKRRLCTPKSARQTAVTAAKSLF